MSIARDMKRLRPAKRPAATLVIMALMAIASIARAAEPEPAAGVIVVQSNPCLMVKYGHGRPCEAPTVPQTADASQRVAAHLARAQFFVETAELARALSEADAALELDSNNADVHHLAARLAMSMGDLTRAAREIALALQQSPDDANLQATNAVRLELQQTPEAALRAFNDILSRHPDHAFSREARAKLALSMGMPADAIADLSILLAGANPKTELLPLRATAYVQINKPELAIADYTRAMAEHPQQLDLLSGRAIAYALAGDDTAALADLDTILGPIGGTPRYAIGGDQLIQYRTQRAFVFRRLKRFADAATEMINALNDGGRAAVLRAQIFLRHNGFPETPLDGRDSDTLRTALQACFGLNSCFARISDEL
jgi:tetratricopeptide (TPR) repeat protein